MQYSYVIYNGAAEPVLLADIKDYLCIDYSTHDTLLGYMITAAREAAEEFCNRAFIKKTITYQTTNFEDAFLLPFPEHTSITSVQVDGSDAEYTKTGLTQFELTVSTVGSECVVVYLATPVVTERMKQAVRMIVKDLYDNQADPKISENTYAFMLPLRVFQ